MSLQWDKTFIEIAEKISCHSTCAKVQVGAVMSIDNRIISIGYNGVPAGETHCNELFDSNEFMFHPGEDTETEEQLNRIEKYKQQHTDFQKKHEIHAEANCLLYAARKGVKTEGATIYCTMSPCNDCSKLIIAAGIKRVVYKDLYDKEIEGLNLMKNCGLEVMKIKE